MKSFVKEKQHKFNKEEIEEFVKESQSIADVCRKCGWKAKGGNYEIVKKYLKDFNISTEHFTSKKSNLNNTLNKHNMKKAKDYLTIESHVRTTNLKKKLFEEGLKEYRCECCGLNEWNGKPINLQIHHINGVHTDNRIENIQILCPNCHSQTDNFCGKNRQNKKNKFCEKCGEVLKDKRSRFCVKCGNIHAHILQRKVERPNKETLLKLILTETFDAIGKRYGVSDKTITKWCIAYGIPHRKRDLKKFNF